MKKIIVSIVVLFAFAPYVTGQIENPVEWSFTKEKVSDGVYDLYFTALIDEGWLIYGLDLEAGGPVATSITFNENENIRLTGDLQAPEALVKYDPNFEMDLSMYPAPSVQIIQRVELLSESTEVTGELVYMACNDSSCLPPDYIDFSVELTGQTSNSNPVIPDEEKEMNTTEQDVVDTETPSLERKTEIILADEDTDGDSAEETVVSEEGQVPAGSRSVWAVFVTGLLGGLLALLTPCVFPMIPLTVSFFLRNAGNRFRAVRDALFYGFTIIFAYVVIGLAISIIFGADTLNALATSPGFNIFFFALLVFFAASFFGAFELTMPSSWSNKLDSKADQTGGLLGVVLMGLTFVLVSFSCTGPIVGTLLVDAATGGNLFGPAMGMFGFSLALAIPFTLFAVFPTALKSLPKSGGWMNAVKVVLGFIVLAFSLKFLSTADSVGQWGILDREVFIVLWIAIFLLMGLYLIGKIKFAHDSDLKYMSVPRLVLAILSFAFVFYLLPGLWGAPLKIISSFLPSPATQDFDLTSMSPATAGANASNTIYVGESVKEGPHGLLAFTDYNEGMEAAEKAGKPVFLDFTGLGCTNCRKMEANVWSDPQVLDKLKNDFVKISLFVDDRTRLPEDEQFVSTALGRERTIKTVGQKWSVFQAERYNINTQPYYLILDHDEDMLSGPYGYDPDIEKFTRFLEKGTQEY